MKTDEISSSEVLRELYGAPMELALKKQQHQLDMHSRMFLELSPFAILATSSGNGYTDCSPRGDHPGFIQILDDETIVIPDRAGNNRLDSLSNILENPNVSVLSLTPGFKECLRINGRAKISVDDDLVWCAEYQGKVPKSVIVVSIQEVYFHCTNAISRAGLWDTESQADRSLMPSLRQILAEQIAP